MKRENCQRPRIFLSHISSSLIRSRWKIVDHNFVPAFYFLHVAWKPSSRSCHNNREIITTSRFTGFRLFEFWMAVDDSSVWIITVRQLSSTLSVCGELSQISSLNCSLNHSCCNICSNSPVYKVSNRLIYSLSRQFKSFSVWRSLFLWKSHIRPLTEYIMESTGPWRPRRASEACTAASIFRHHWSSTIKNKNTELAQPITILSRIVHRTTHRHHHSPGSKVQFYSIVSRTCSKRRRNLR